MGWFWSKNKAKNEKFENLTIEMQQRLQRIEEIKIAEAKAERKRKIRHALYDFSKSVVGFFRRTFGKKIRESDEIRKAGDKKLVNRETIFLGGTKPMSQYTATDGSKWLAKQAVNCMGYYKISGVLLTVAGANIQKLVDPKTAIDAYRGKTVEDGDVSFQQKIENTVSSKDVNLFKFSKHPELAGENDIAIVEGLGNDLLREHVTDWLLCNFDTKGENFLIRYSNKGFELLGIDKEASFSKINDPDARHMSSTYQPHANNTLYNAVFEMYRKGKIDLNLDVMKEKVNELVKMDPDEYMKNFKDYLDHERKKNPATYADTYMKIRARKQSLGEEYNKFFTSLVADRMKAKPEEAEKLKERYFNAGEGCKLFEPRDYSPKAAANDLTTRIREESFAKIVNGQITPQNIAAFMAVEGLRVKLKNGAFDKASKAQIEKTFNEASIAKISDEFSDKPAVSAIIDVIKSGIIDVSKMRDSTELRNNILPHLRTLAEQKNREKFDERGMSMENDENLSTERNVVFM